MELKVEENKFQQKQIEDNKQMLKIYAEKSQLAQRNFEEMNISKKH